MDYDRIMVLKDGIVVEFDSPNVLLQNENGIFANMVAASAAHTASNN